MVLDGIGADNGTARLRLIVAIAGCVYLAWWFMVELLLPGSFNPLPGRVLVVGLCGLLFGASYWSRWVESRLSLLLTVWVCILVSHYCYLLLGNHGDSAWWVGAFVTFAAAGMCLPSQREVAAFSVYALACVVVVAQVGGQLRHSIYVPGLATILLLANITKRSQRIAHSATLQAERARKASQSADEQRFQLAAIVESSADAIIATSLEGVILSWNKGAERLFGYVAGEAVGQPIAFLLPPGHGGEEPALIAHLMKGEPVAPFESVRRRKDASELHVSITISPIHDSLGELVGASLAARDISDRKRAEQALARAKEAAETANRELEAFSYSVAHDLRAPLRGIDGFSQALLEDYSDELDAEGRRLLGRVRESAQHMAQLIESLLALAHLTQSDLHRERVDLSELARAAARRLTALHPERHVEILVTDGLVETGDSRLLGVAFENLFGNAWKFTRDQPEPRIEFGRMRQDGQSIFFVRDNGAGFDMAFAPKLFGVFQRLHTAREFEGTGIGLATVQRIVRRHGGRIWAEAKVASGAAFYFTLGEGSEDE